MGFEPMPFKNRTIAVALSHLSQPPSHLTNITNAYGNVKLYKLTFIAWLVVRRPNS